MISGLSPSLANHIDRTSRSTLRYPPFGPLDFVTVESYSNTTLNTVALNLEQSAKPCIVFPSDEKIQVEGGRFLPVYCMSHIYVADDNTEFAEFLATVAKREGWTVSLCSNGIELLEKLQSEDGPAFVLVDINMPEMNGIEVIDDMSEIDRPLRVRFVTGGSDATLLAAKMIASARSLSVGRSVFKPVTLDAFRKLLNEEEAKLAAL